MPTLIRYRWRYFDEMRQIYITTRHRATENDITAAHPDALPVEGTRQVLEVPDDVSINSTAIFNATSRRCPIAHFRAACT